MRIFVLIRPSNADNEIENIVINGFFEILL